MIGSSAGLLFCSNGCPGGCDGTGESCKPPKINTQITVEQRQRRTIPYPPKVGNRGKTLLMSIFS
jgi:hypothetical protein